jgi:cytochrome c peroxidase
MTAASRSWRAGLGALALNLGALWFIAGCNSGQAPAFPNENEGGAPAEQNIGERIFVETRFAQFFAVNMTDVNAPLAVGDPVVAQTQTTNGPLPGPFAGQSINCRSCHFVVEFQGVSGAGNRTYADFIDHSPIPRPMNGFTTTQRNAMQMVNSLQAHSGPTFLHFDGQFTDPADLVKSTLTGRNFGWAPDQYPQAVAHIARIIREDNGQNTPAVEYGCNLSYAKILLGTDPSIPADCKLPVQYRLDVTSASDEQIVDDLAQMVAQYAYGLLFKQDQFGRYIASPYDVFLRVNHLPVQPMAGETDQQYNRRLSQLVETLTNPVYVDGTNGSFKYHMQTFTFGPTELAGLKIFLRAANAATDGSQHAGNCAACHLAPNFSDFKFHNTGASQEEYDAANGSGAFAQLAIPGLADRGQNFDAYLPVSASHPNASERFRHPAVAGSPQYADLGLWNVYLNPDIPNPQTNLSTVVCANASNCAVDQGLATTIAQFKTPTLRDGEDSQPYFHNGSKLKFGDVVEFYIRSSQLARAGQLRNAPLEFQGMSLSEDDVNSLVAFLRALTEDYDDA